MINVLQIINDGTIGGINTVVNSLSEIFRNDTDINLLTFVYGNKNQSSINFKNTHNKYFLYYKNIFILLKNLRKQVKNSDIVILHGFTPIISFFTINSKSKFVFINHGVLGTGRKLKSHEIIKKYLLIIFLKYFIDVIISVSYFAKNKIISDYKIQDTKIKVIYNSTNLERIENTKSKCDKITLGYHGRFVDFKRIDRLLNVSNLLNKQFPSRVILMGSGPLIEEYNKLSKKLNVDLEIKEYTDDIAKNIKQYDFEIIPSNEENFGISVLESILCGNITFVFADGGGCTEIFGSEYSWYVCQNEREMVNKIYSLYNDYSSNDKERFNSLQEYVLNKLSSSVFKNNYKNLLLNLTE